MPSDCDDDEVVTGTQEYTTQEVGQMVFDMQLRQAKYEKKMMAHKHEQEAVVRQQMIVNHNINDALTNLAASLRTKTALQQVLLPSELLRGRPLDTPVRAVAERTVLVDGVPQVQWLVHWASDVGATPTWAPKAELVQDYPHFHLEGKVIPDEGGVDRDMFAETANEGNQRESEDEEESTSHEPDRGEQREDRRSKRIRKPPVRYGDFV
ncbi:hypothetical protein SASPL_131280 [Salvia splendens]|uniref:Chromo domain-containing protein n=1 Tax=Salvia splendens TaxID=180675 RepID=A0A8X8X9S9_SALSN|nr:hypothetical protein SASPL_131280 [Salvia splendens]